MVDYGMICDRLLRHSCRILMTLGLLVTASLGLGAEQRLPDAAKTARPHLPENDIKRFCLNNAAAAGDARIACTNWKKKSVNAWPNSIPRQRSLPSGCEGGRRQ